MFLHIGNNKNVRERQIIGIFDADTATVSPVTRKFLAAAQKRGDVSAAGSDLPKSFVLLRGADEKKTYTVVFSQLSAAALVGRTEK